MIEFRDVTKTYPDGTHAVRGFSLVIPARQITVLVGSSGSGKTTLMRMINRMVDPTSGSVEIDGQDISQIEPVKLPAKSPGENDDRPPEPIAELRYQSGCARSN